MGDLHDSAAAAVGGSVSHIPWAFLLFKASTVAAGGWKIGVGVGFFSLFLAWLVRGWWRWKLGIALQQSEPFRI